MTIIIRRPYLDDLDRILEVEHSNFTTDFITRQELKRNLRTCRVLIVDGDIAGYSLWLNNYDDISGNCYLYSLVVDKYYRRRGYSRLLLDHFLSNEATTHSLHVSVSNKTAISLYESVGFKPVETIERFYEDGGSALLMLRRNEDEN